MYSNCHICQGALGTNAVVEHMPVGARLAYDVVRGRLWVVCPSCSEWNLTPLEERWESIEECERVFRDADARASSAHVGVSRSQGIDLIRIGPALRDELANWRYGPRFHRRRRRARLFSAAAGGIALAGVGGAALAGALTSGVAFGLWATAMAVSYVAPLVAPLTRRMGPRRDVRFVDTDGRTLLVPYAYLGDVSLSRENRKHRASTIGVMVPDVDGVVELREVSALLALGTILPRLNWRGARPSSIRRATALLDQAEERMTDTRRSATAAATPWEWLAISYCPGGGAIHEMDTIARHALEMAVSEELERRAMVGEAHVLGSRWSEAETVAAIADDMFVPDSIREWIRAHRRP